MPIHFIDDSGSVHLRPFVYARVNKRDPVTLRLSAVEDRSKIWPLEFFVRGEPYKFWGLIPTDLHFFGVQTGFVHLFGTDSLGRDQFSRTMYATRVSLSSASSASRCRSCSARSLAALPAMSAASPT